MSSTHNAPALTPDARPALLDALLSVALPIPTNIPPNILSAEGLPLVVLWDCRKEADAAMLEAVAGRHGAIAALSLNHQDLIEHSGLGEAG